MCFWPMHGWRARTVGKSGKRAITFDPKKGYIDMPVTLPCGKCIDCKLNLSRQWAIRCMHESDQQEDNCYITLTYAPKYLPEGATLYMKDFQDFMKRLRKKYCTYDQDEFGNRYCVNPIKFYHSGEYGEATQKNNWIARPHYHALLFNIDFSDCVPFKEINGITLFVSRKLTKIWGKGHASIGRVTMDSAAYVARYIMKKQYPSKNEAAQARYVENYERIDRDTGEIHTVKPEYSTMSKNIGKAWFDKYKTDVYPSDFLTYKGQKFRPPKAYDRFFEKEQPEEMAKIKAKRTGNMRKQAKNNTPERLLVREKCKKIQISRLTRELGET